MFYHSSSTIRTVLILLYLDWEGSGEIKPSFKFSILQYLQLVLLVAFCLFMYRLVTI